DLELDVRGCRLRHQRVNVCQNALLEAFRFNFHAVITGCHKVETVDARIVTRRGSTRVRGWVQKIDGRARNDISLRVRDCAAYRGCSGLAESRQTSQHADQ